jgi:stress response protein YsnF
MASTQFVVDGNWVTNESAPKEADSNGIFNNVLTSADIRDPVSTLSSAAPLSSTAALAGAVPKEDTRSRSNESIPGAFPLTPPVDSVETPFHEPQAFSVNPIPATEGLGNPVRLAPGEKVPDASTLTSNTVQSTVKHEEPEEAKVSVAPLPATAGPGNPIHLAPGEKVPDPSTFTSNTVQSTVKTDPASYDKSSGLPPQLGPVVTPQAERDAKGGMFSLPSVLGGIIPESSLPMGSSAKTEHDPGFTVQSAAPTSTTAALAGQVPLEPRGVPDTVIESQKEAGFAPEASANPEAVEEKQELEQELKAKVPEEPATTESSSLGQAAAIAAGGATAAAGAFAAATYAAKNKAAEAVGLPNDQTTTAAVPEVVADSQKEAHASPEASANPVAVEEKSEVESELLKEVKKVNDSGESAPTTGIAAGAVGAAGAVAAGAYAAKDKAAETVGLKNDQTTSAAVPEVVADSQKEAHASPEASANPVAVEEKSEVESELLKEVKKVNDSGESAPTTGIAAGVGAGAVGAAGAVAAATYAAKDKAADAVGLNGQATASDVPEVVAESQKEAHASPEASANPEAVEEKKEVESELLKEVKKTQESGEPAPTLAAATSAIAPGQTDVKPLDFKPFDATKESDGLNAPASAPAIPETSRPVVDSRDVSPMSKQPTTQQTQPTVTTGVESSTTAAKTEAVTPKKDAAEPSKASPAPESVASEATDKKKKRRSFFGKLKDKLSK